MTSIKLVHVSLLSSESTTTRQYKSNTPMYVLVALTGIIKILKFMNTISLQTYINNVVTLKY